MPSVTPAITDVPVLVMFPEAKGVPAVGRTRTFCQVMVFSAPPELLLEMVKVSWVGGVERSRAGGPEHYVEGLSACGEGIGGRQNCSGVCGRKANGIGNGVDQVPVRIHSANGDVERNIHGFRAWGASLSSCR